MAQNIKIWRGKSEASTLQGKSKQQVEAFLRRMEFEGFFIDGFVGHHYLKGNVWKNCIIWFFDYHSLPKVVCEEI